MSVIVPTGRIVLRKTCRLWGVTNAYISQFLTRFYP
jgi:hypothetical protein